jgi:dipeptidyl-peptidase-4
VRRLTTTESYETDAQYSPRGRYVSFIRDQDLYAVEVASGVERRLTSGGGGLIGHGVAEFIAQEEMNRNTGYWWSPDERHVAFTRVDESPVAEIERVEVHADGFKVHHQRYPVAGAANADVRLAILALETGAITWLDLGHEDSYLARVHWFPEGDRLLIQRQSRDQKRLDLLAYPAAEAAADCCFPRPAPPGSSFHDDLHFMPRRQELLWHRKEAATITCTATTMRTADRRRDSGRLGRRRRVAGAQVRGIDEKRGPRLFHGHAEDAARAAVLHRRPRCGRGARTRCTELA